MIHAICATHHTAPVAWREQLTIADNNLSDFLLRLAPLVDGVAVLSTCNRLEIYIDGIGQANDAILPILAAFVGLDQPMIEPYFVHYAEQDAVSHLMRVACGLDSMVLGETQILGQVAHAYAHAHRIGTTTAALNRLFTQAIHAGKRTHAETDISHNTTSVSHAALTLAETEHGPLSDAHVLVIGAGEMAYLAAGAAAQRKVSALSVINRTYSHAQALAEQVGGAMAYQWSSLWSLLMTVDIVITATGAPHTVLEANDLETVLSRRDRPLSVIDIALPRDVDPKAADCEGLFLYDIDSLQQIVDDGMAQRLACVPAVEQIIRQEVLHYTDWLSSRQIVPTITDFRRKIRSVADAEVQDALKRLNHLDEQDRDVVLRLAHRMVNKILHTPTVNLRERATHGDAERYSRVLRDLFALMPDGASNG
jgi:glutamyl-tRNA reductase